MFCQIGEKQVFRARYFTLFAPETSPQEPAQNARATRLANSHCGLFGDVLLAAADLDYDTEGMFRV